MSAPSISGDAFAGKPAYVGESLHVAVSLDGLYTVWANNGDEPIARCVDSGTAHLLAAAPDLLAALRDLLGAGPFDLDAARDAIAKAIRS